jgi:N-acetylmuramoyl-L-alanine amidase
MVRDAHFGANRGRPHCVSMACSRAMTASSGWDVVNPTTRLMKSGPSNPTATLRYARENSASGQTMHSLPEIIRAIALNNKIDESRDFATFVQGSLTQRLKTFDRNSKSLGVKQAPFMVLVGATMPSVLAEISFMTNRQEGTLLKTPGYRQQIAEALFDGVMKYQRSLKAEPPVARSGF